MVATTKSARRGPAGRAAAVPPARAAEASQGAGGANAALGRYGEDVAARLLAESGMVVLERNWRCELGELDIVAREGDTLVVCEVKTRRSARFGTPQEAVTRVKMARLRKLALRWMREHEVHPREIRIDVVAVTRGTAGPAQVEHLRGVA